MSGEDYKKDAEYKYGFKDADQTIVSTGKGLSGNRLQDQRQNRCKGEHWRKRKFKLPPSCPHQKSCKG